MTPSEQTYSYPSTFPGLVGLVLEELDRATQKFGPIASLHEGYAVTLEELDEAWLAIRTKGTPPEDIRQELIQVAAMALRTIHDCLDRRSWTEATARDEIELLRPSATQRP